MAIVSTCGCGQVLTAETIEELLKAATTHVVVKHPELVGTLSPLELARPPKPIRRAA